MGTKCLTFFVQDGEYIACLYRQFDGFPESHGKELYEFLHDKKFEDAGDLAVRVITQLKSVAHQVNLDCHKRGSLPGPEPKLDHPGLLYLVSVKDVIETEDYQEYNYFLSCEPEAVHLKVTEYEDDSSPIFDGPITEYNDWLNEYLVNQEDSREPVEDEG